MCASKIQHNKNSVDNLLQFVIIEIDWVGNLGREEDLSDQLWFGFLSLYILKPVRNGSIMEFYASSKWENFQNIFYHFISFSLVIYKYLSEVKYKNMFSCVIFNALPDSLYDKRMSLWPEVEPLQTWKSYVAHSSVLKLLVQEKISVSEFWLSKESLMYYIHKLEGIGKLELY